MRKYKRGNKEDGLAMQMCVSEQGVANKPEWGWDSFTLKPEIIKKLEIWIKEILWSSLHKALFTSPLILT